MAQLRQKRDQACAGRAATRAKTIPRHRDEPLAMLTASDGFPSGHFARSRTSSFDVSPTAPGEDQPIAFLRCRPVRRHEKSGLQSCAVCNVRGIGDPRHAIYRLKVRYLVTRVLQIRDPALDLQRGSYVAVDADELSTHLPRGDIGGALPCSVELAADLADQRRP